MHATSHARSHATSLISLVISTYNRPDALAAVVEACFTQTDTNFEIIIADDGSGVATRECIKALIGRSPAVWSPISSVPPAAR